MNLFRQWLFRLKDAIHKPRNVEESEDYTLAELEELLLGSPIARKKQKWANEGMFLTADVGVDRPRLPPGQRLTAGLPVLDLGHRPEIALSEWRMKIDGLVESGRELSWQDFQSLPRQTYVHDIHCVTAWSSFDQSFEGVSTKVIEALVKPLSTAKAVMVESYDGYSTNLKVEDFFATGCLLADRWDGKSLEVIHGGPLRLVVPHLYFWKSAKWIKRLTFMSEEQRGFWKRVVITCVVIRGDSKDIVL